MGSLIYEDAQPEYYTDNDEQWAWAHIRMLFLVCSMAHSTIGIRRDVCCFFFSSSSSYFSALHFIGQTHKRLRANEIYTDTNRQPNDLSHTDCVAYIPNDVIVIYYNIHVYSYIYIILENVAM